MSGTHQEAPHAGSLAYHLEQLALSADDVAAFVNRAHEEGEIHPEALAEAEKLPLRLREVIDAILHNTHLEHLAITSDDVWHQLTIKHKSDSAGTIS